MIRRKTAALILIVACGPIASAQDPLNGQWIGGHLAEEGYVWVRMRVQTDSGGGRPAVVDVPFQLRNGQRSPIRLTDGRVRFDFAQRAGRTEVVAELRGDTIRGVATTAGPEREFRMTRVQPITGEMAGRLSGMYETGDHHLVAVGASGEWGSITTWTSRPA